jgi:methionyl-tRNA synthetase
LPVSTEKIWQQLGQSGALEDVRIDRLAWGALRPGTLIGEPAAVFPRVEKTETLEKIAAMEQEILKPQGTPAASTTPAVGPAAQPVAAAATPANSSAANAKIGIDDFSKVEMRVGEVKSAERVAGADKLLKVMVDMGDEVRQIVAGIATAYQPEQLVGRKVVVVVNLQPRKLRGVESNGMIVAASVGPEGKPVLAGFLEDVPVGSRLK